jgi:hypothetical protein
MTVNWVGDVGIGETSPDEKLHVSSGGGANGDCVLLIEADADNTVEASNAILRLKQDGGAITGALSLTSNNEMTLYNEQTGKLFLGVGNSPMMSINSAGNVGIGTTIANVRLEIGGGSTLARVIPSVNNQGYIGDGNHRWQAIYATNGTIVTSDVREKEEIKSTQLGLDFVNDLNPVSFKWIDNERLDASKDKRNHQGLIAQEVAKTLEKHGVNKNEFGGLDIQKTDEYDDFHAMSYEQLIAPMIKAIQELKAEIEELKKQINK